MSLEKKIRLAYLLKQEKDKQNKKVKKHDFVLDCNSQEVKLPQYNAFRDKNLSSFLENVVVKKHLEKMRLINEKGHYYTEKEYALLTKQNAAQKEIKNIDDIKKSTKFISIHQYKLPRLPNMIKTQKAKQNTRSVNYSTVPTKEDSILKPLTKEEFKDFLKIYKKETTN